MKTAWYLAHNLVSCCIALLLLAALSPAYAALPSNGDIVNNCPEGQYLVPLEYEGASAGKCLPLDHPEFGFDPATFPNVSSNTVVTECSPNAIENAIDQMPASGGILQLPACDGLMGRVEVNKSNIIIQGEGIDATRLTMTGSNGFIVTNATNVVIRDMTLTGSLVPNAVVFENVTNGLVERLFVPRARHGVVFRNSDQITVRYIRVDASEFHGASSKDCSSSDLSIASCGGVDAISQRNSIYSNNVSGSTKEYGLDYHNSFIEIAGNYAHDTQYGLKTPDGHAVYVHHNLFERTRGTWATRTYNILSDVGAQFGEQVQCFYENVFRDNQGSPIYLANGTGGNLGTYYAVNNYYEGANPDNRISDGALSVIPGSIDEVKSGSTIPIDLAAFTTACGANANPIPQEPIVEPIPIEYPIPTRSLYPTKFPTKTPGPTMLECDLCGKCVGEPSIPADYNACVQCMYGDAGDANNPAHQLDIAPLVGNQWTIAGCVQTTANQAVQSTITLMTYTTGGITMLLLLYGGSLVLTSQGDTVMLAQGKRIIAGSLLALLITLFAGFVLQTAGVTLLNIPGFG